MKSALSLFICMAFIGPGLHAQNIVVDGVALANAGGKPTNCAVNSYRLKGTAAASGSCVSLTSNTFDAGALWVCDPINLNESFKVYFEANFDSFNSGDGMAFVLQNEGVPVTLGAEGGGLGYSLGNLTGCIPFGDCIISPSVVVELDIWDNSAAVWDAANPGLGTINDIPCDHASIQTNGIQLTSNALVPPTCLLPGGVDVTDGLNHDVCIIWDVINLQYSVYFDTALVVVYNGDIRTNFGTPTSVFWGFTAGSGGATQDQRVCNVDMLTNIANPFCTVTPLPVEMSSFSGHSEEAINVLEWVTESEHNSDFFAVERSADAKQFSEFAQVDAAGTSVQKLYYSVRDDSPFSGVTYYRLKQVDEDGQFEYSETIALDNRHHADITVFPSPADNIVTVTLVEDPEMTIPVVVRNAVGKTVRVTEFDQRVEIVDVSALPSGIYFITMIIDGEPTVQKFCVK